MLETRIHQHNSAGLASEEDELIYNENGKNACLCSSGMNFIAPIKA